MAADQLGLGAVHEDRAGAGEGIEVVRAGVLVGAGVEEGEHLAGLDLGQPGVRDQHVERAGAAGDIGDQRGLGRRPVRAITVQRLNSRLTSGRYASEVSVSTQVSGVGIVWRLTLPTVARWIPASA